MNNARRAAYLRSMTPSGRNLFVFVSLMMQAIRLLWCPRKIHLFVLAAAAATLLDAQVVQFSDPMKYPTGRVPSQVFVTDFNRDGQPDVATLTWDGISLLLGRGDGTFQSAKTISINFNVLFPVAMKGFAVGDFNGDSKPDIVAAGTYFGNVDRQYHYVLCLLIGNGDGTFQAPTFTGLDDYTFLDGAADLNGDGRSDAILDHNGTLVVFLSNGDGTLRQPISSGAPSSFDSLVTADLNRDGRIDVLLAVQNGGYVTVLFGNGDGSFRQGPALQFPNGVNRAIAGDLNNDGNLDIIAISTAYSLATVFLGNGDGTFQAGKAFSAGIFPTGYPTYFAMGDLNGDGRPDVVIAQSPFTQDSTLTILVGNGDGTLQSPIPIPSGGFPVSVVAADVNNDGRPDIVVANGFIDGSVSVLLNTAAIAPTVSVTITSNVPGLSFTMDQTSYAAPRTFAWPAGSRHSVAWLSPQPTGTGARGVFLNWADGDTTNPRVIVAPTTNVVYSAVCKAQYLLTLINSGIGNSLVAYAENTSTTFSDNGYFDVGTTVRIEANPTIGYQFNGFGGDITANVSPQRIVMDRPHVVSANFTLAVGLSVSPSSGSGSSQTFQFLASDPIGATDLQTVWIWITPAFGTSSVGSCLLYYDRGVNLIRLLNDASNTWMPMTPGTGILQNSQCSVDASAIAVTPSGNNLAVSIPVSFKAGYAGAQQVWMYAGGAAGNSGWQQRGSWIATAPPPPVAPVSAVSVTPASGSGPSQTFQFLASDSNGATDLNQVWMWITPAFSSSSANTCLLYYDQKTNLLYLLNDAATTWMTMTPGATGTLQNSQCGIDLSATTIAPSANNLTVSLPISFKAALVGTQQIWMYAAGGVGNSGWKQLGTWAVTAPPPPPAPVVSAVSVTPASGSGLSQSFQILASDSNGFADLTQIWIWITPAFGNSSANSCLLYYTRPTNVLNLLNDAGNTWMPTTAGTAGTLENSQCSVDVSTVAVTPSGNNLTVALPVSFKAGYAGNQQVWMYVGGAAGNSGWQQRGTWTAIAPAVAVSVSVGPTSVSLSGGQSQQFTATVSNTSNTAVTWSQSPVGVGTLSSSGLYTAPTTASAQQAVTITATSVADTTKSASATVTLTPPVQGVQAVSVTPNTGSGSSQTLQFLSSDPAGTADLTQVWMWFTATFSNSSANSCLLYYNQTSNQVLLLNDGATTWMPMTVGTAGTLQNSQCSLNVGSVAITRSGNNLTVSVPMTFQAAYAGAKQVWMYAGGGAGNSGWQQRGTWTATAPAAPAVSAVSVTPNVGSGLTQTFQLLASDSNGSTDLTQVWVWFTAAFSNVSANSCLLYYSQTANQVYLLNDAGNTWMPMTPGTAGTLQNSQCSLNVGAMTLTPSGTNLTVTLPMTFKAPYAGLKQVWMYAAGGIGNTGWQQRGTWTVQ